MKISLLTLYTPTPENVRGPSALPYYLLKHRHPDIEVEVYSFNRNQVSKEQVRCVEQALNLHIHLWSLPVWYRFLEKFHLTMVRVFLNYPLFCYIQPSKKQLAQLTTNHPDVIWHYMDTFIGVSNRLPQYKHVITGPDSPSLVYYRQIVDLPSFRNLIFYLGLSKVVYASVRQMRYPVGDNVVYHIVGKEDCDVIHRADPHKRCVFLLHPHYELAHEISVNFSKRPLSILFAGAYNFYTFTAMDNAISALANMDEHLKQAFSFTFLGAGWEKCCQILTHAGCKATHIRWVDNYVESISKYDIFLYPISVGAGTKGKMLDALANGLLAIGTNVALENISVTDGESCIIYQQTRQLPGILDDILSRPSHYENITRRGMEQVRKYHAPERCSAQFFNFVTAFYNNELKDA